MKTKGDIARFVARQGVSFDSRVFVDVSALPTVNDHAHPCFQGRSKAVFR